MRQYLACGIILLLNVLSLPAFAWHTNTHLQMTRDAISLMPEEFKQTFVQNRQFVEAGITDPDELIRDWQNHFYTPAASEGGALDRIDKLITIVQNKLKTSHKTDASKQLCYLAHYIGDLWSPEALIKQDTGSNMDFLKTNNIVVSFEGYEKPVENLHDYLKSRSEWRWKLENSKEISTLLYSEAVNDIAVSWLTLWHQSGHTVVPLDPLVLEHKIDVLSVKSGYYSGGKVYWKDTSYDQSWYRTSRSANRTLYEQVRLRNEQAMLAKLAPAAPFTMLESSLKKIGDQSYFVARIRIKGDQEVPSIAFLYPGVKGSAATVTNLSPGQVSKVEAVLPLNANKDQIQIIFATLE